MFRRHVIPQLVAYYHGELPSTRARRVAAHLERCPGCRAEFEALQAGQELLASLPRAAAPASLWGKIEAALEQPESASERGQRRGVPIHAFRWASHRAPALLAALGILVLGIGLVRVYQRLRAPAWTVAGLAGVPRVDSAAIGATGRLRVGQWLETDASSRARIEVGGLGHVEVEPNTRVGLLNAREREHRLSLAHGTLEAFITAPPRLFFVDTPSAVAVDLGCYYTLHVDRTGHGLLQVSLGWVAFEWQGRASVVPMGGACETRPGAGPGTPYFEDAPAALRKALSRFDFEHGGAPMLHVVLTQARRQDAFTLWHLLARVDVKERVLVYQRLSQFLPPPSGVTREGVMGLDPAQLDEWRKAIEDSWWS